jgi:hypothetical protein
VFKHLEGIICLLEHGADVNMKDNVSTATSGALIVVLNSGAESSLKTLNSGVAVMVEMVIGGGEG